MVIVNAQQITQHTWDIEWNAVILNVIEKKENHKNEPLFTNQFTQML